MKTKLTLAALGLMLVTGCHSIGPGTVTRDRFDYSKSLGDSWKEQMLLNIVKLRYLDPPFFVDVGQIVSGYTLQTGLSAGGSFPSNDKFGGNTAIVGGSAQFTDRPTITYTPLTGNKFIKSLMTPLPPDSVFFMIQSGWPADKVLFATMARMNGLNNQSATIDGVAPPDPDFLRVLALMRRIQLSGSVAMRIQQDAPNKQSTVLTFRSKNISPETLADIHELRRLLHLDPDAPDIRLVFGDNPVDDKEMAVITRSMMQMMNIMASEADVPDKDVTDGSVTPGWDTLTNNSTAVTNNPAAHLIQIHWSKNEPAHAFVSISYRDHWFWIDDHDLKSKRTFSFMLLLFTLADTGDKEPLPLITIPAQ